jgi:hypothetical protein
MPMSTMPHSTKANRRRLAMHARAEVEREARRLGDALGLSVDGRRSGGWTTDAGQRHRPSCAVRSGIEAALRKQQRWRNAPTCWCS